MSDTTITVPSVQTIIVPPLAITTVLQVGQGPSGPPGTLADVEMPFDPVLNLENALA